MSEVKVFNTGVNPVHSGLYVVDREKLGQPFRWFNVETGVWSRCEYDYEHVGEVKDSVSPIGFLPWRGPVKVVPMTVKTSEVFEAKLVQVADEVDHSASNAVIAKVAKVKAPKVAKVKAPKVTKVKYPDGSIVAHPTRGGFDGYFGGKAEAHRDTVEKVQSFLKKKYNVEGTLVA